MFGIDSYRWDTRWKALKSLYSLQSHEIDAFMDAYRLFDGDWSNLNGKREEQIIDYYNVLNHLCSLGTIEKMYFPPRIDAKAGVVANQELFERKLMRDTEIRSDSRVLDMGCGRGRVAHHVARRTGAQVTGINIDPSQLENAREYARRTGFEHRTTFQQGSLNDPLPFPDESFDAAYEIQAFSYAKDIVGVYTEFARVLKPGSRFCVLDWVLLPAYDEENPEHVELLDRARPLLGAVESPTVVELEAAMEKAGLHVVISENPSVGERQYQMITAEDRYFHALRELVRWGSKLRLFPAYFPPLLDRLMLGADALIEMDRSGIATTCYQIVGEKAV